MKNILFGIVFICPPFLKKLILKWFCGAQFGRKSSIGWFSSITGSRITMGDYSTIKPLTLIRCDGEVTIGNYTEISSFAVIYGCANFCVGNKCYIGPQTWINVSEDVVMGEGVGIGPRTMIFTHGSFLPYTEGYPVRFGKVTIGDTVWIPAGVFIQPGIQVGDNVLVNSRSVLTKSIPSGQYAAGFPAKPIRPMDKIRRSVTPAVRDELILDVLKHFISFLKKVKKKVKITHYTDNTVAIRLHGKDYLISLVNSHGVGSPELEKNYNKIIILLNRSDWKPPRLEDKMTIFNFATMKTSYSADKFCHQLYLFLKQYYGIIFEFD